MPRKSLASPSRICFVTGSRADFGLMRTVLRAIQTNPRLKLQIVATGMHLDSRRGRTIERVFSDGWHVDAVVPWKKASRAVATGQAIAALAGKFTDLKPDIVLLVGDRVEAFAAAAAAHLSEIATAHVHGGDRALGQMDDVLRHAITKLSHIHFPATAESAERILRMGEDRWRIHRVGSPGVDQIARVAAPSGEIAAAFPGISPGQFALILLHPVDADDSLESQRADAVWRGVVAAGLKHSVIVCPNNDPGSGGIIRCWRQLTGDSRFIVRPDIPRPQFLGLLRDAALLVGNSSSGIIEAAAFRTPVIDVGPRQHGRQRCEDVRNVPYRQSRIAAAAREIWRRGHPRRGKCRNVYGGNGAGEKIAAVLTRAKLNSRLLRKIIAY